MAKKILDLKYFEGGDIIDKISKEQEIIEAVSKSENITTNEAIKKLNGRSEDLNKITKDITQISTDETDGHRLENNFKITKEDVKEVEEKPINLSEVVEFYHKKLITQIYTDETDGHRLGEETQSVIDLLKSFNLDNTFWRLFKLGTANGSLLDSVSQKQKEELKKISLLDENYIEVLLNSLTIPIIDENDIVTGIIGLDTTGCIKTIGNTKTLFNLKVSKMYDELIFTDNFALCFKLLGTGFNNVICANLEDFDAGNLKTLKNNRVKTIIVISESLSNIDLVKEVLLEDFRVKTINLALKQAIVREEILTLIDKS